MSATTSEFACTVFCVARLCVARFGGGPLFLGSPETSSLDSTFFDQSVNNSDARSVAPILTVDCCTSMNKERGEHTVGCADFTIVRASSLVTVQLPSMSNPEAYGRTIGETRRRLLQCCSTDVLQCNIKTKSNNQTFERCSVHFQWVEGLLCRRFRLEQRAALKIHPLWVEGGELLTPEHVARGEALTP